MGAAGRRWGRRERALLWTILVAAWDAAWGQLRYSVPEELPKGSFVGDVAKDLGLEMPALRDRGIRVASEGRMQYFTLHGKTGHLVTAERIDREQLCRLVEKCVLRCEVIVEGDMKFYEIEVEITDINDNAPSFRQAEKELRMSEMTAPGSRFPLVEAHDPDSGPNSLQRYELSGDEHFSLAVQAGPGGDQRPELVLAKALDREEAAFHELVLRASDGGEPARTGTARIRVAVLDANDNAPVFSQEEYTVRVPEDMPVGSLLVIVTASDADEGLNGHVKYIFHKISDRASELFHLDSETGEISLKDNLDFEEVSTHELEVQALDGGELFDAAKVAITVTDVNDNYPEISVRSFLSEISEDSPSGTVVALLHVQDRDSGVNGQVRCSLDEGVPFRLRSSQGSYYSVMTSRELDREKVSEYNVTVRAVDGGSPVKESSAVLALRVLDVNDNAPVFAEPRYSARLAENNAAGALVLTVRATDADWGQNARVRYRLSEGRVRGAPLSSYVSVQAETGALYALRSFDYEEVREFAVVVRAQDGGEPARSSTATVRVFVLDRNDNAPRVLWPAPVPGEDPGSTPFEMVPRSAEAGYLVAKVVAVDADAGRNAWLSYELVQAPEPALFRVGLHSGEVRTARAVSDRDAAKQRLVAVVKDHGQPALSATATLHVVLAESLQEALPELSDRDAVSELTSDLNLILVVALAAVCCLFFFTVILILFFKCRRSRSPPVFITSDKEMYSTLGSKAPYNYCSSTLPLPYSYEVCLASESGQKDFTFVRPEAAALSDHLQAREPGSGTDSGKDPPSPGISTQALPVPWFTQCREPAGLLLYGNGNRSRPRRTRPCISLRLAGRNRYQRASWEAVRAGGRIKPRTLRFVGKDACGYSDGTWRGRLGRVQEVPVPGAPGNPAAGAALRGDCAAAGAAAHHSAALNLCRFTGYAALAAQRLDAVRYQEGSDQALGWQNRHSEGPEGHGAGFLRRPVYSGRPSSPSLLVPAASFQRGFPGTSPPSPVSIPLSGVILSTISYTFLPAHGSPRALSTLPLPARLSLSAGFLTGIFFPFGVNGLEQRCLRAGAAALTDERCPSAGFR
ncbi:protocadherin gamma-A10-like [Pezoporus occidentalis]|uniref:protocadherin gamma-A10-like n=1 Tax=Pezoporus occidentalis TaxID=407982 RepID=UPI002F915E85